MKDIIHFSNVHEWGLFLGGEIGWGVAIGGAPLCKIIQHKIIQHVLIISKDRFRFCQHRRYFSVCLVCFS